MAVEASLGIVSPVVEASGTQDSGLELAVLHLGVCGTRQAAFLGVSGAVVTLSGMTLLGSLTPGAEALGRQRASRVLLRLCAVTLVAAFGPFQVIVGRSGHLE